MRDGGYDRRNVIYVPWASTEGVLCVRRLGWAGCVRVVIRRPLKLANTFSCVGKCEPFLT